MDLAQGMNYIRQELPLRWLESRAPLSVTKNTIFSVKNKSV